MGRWSMLVLAALLVAACGSTPGPAGSPVASSPSTPSSSTSGPQAGAGTPDASVPPSGGPSGSPTGAADLPAGIQFLDRAALMPRGFGRAPVVLGGQAIYLGSLGGVLSWATRTATDWITGPIGAVRGYAAPVGRPYLQAPGFAAGPAAATSTGAVLAATATYSAIRSGSTTTTARESVLWSSADGRSWTMFDPRILLGGTDSAALITDVAATGTGFLAAGTLTTASGTARSTLFVLGSPDGRTWTRLGTISGTWALGGGRILSLGNVLLLAGDELACTADGSGTALYAPGAQARLWRSADGGATWEAVDLTAIASVIHSPAPAPADASGCPKGVTGPGLDAPFRSTGSILGVVDGHAVALSDDGGTVAASSDLATWTTVTLPGALSADTPPARSLASLATSGPGGWVLREVQPRRGTDNTAIRPGYQVNWWTSADAGATWTAQAPGKPMSIGGAFYTMTQRSDGTVDLVAVPTSASGLDAVSEVMSSVAGAAVDWTRCAAVPGAFCEYASRLDVPAATTDLHAIDLTGATLTGVDLPGMNLGNALLGSAVLDGNLAGADLSGAMLEGATVAGVLDKADLALSDLSTATITASLAGARLRGATIYSAKLSGDLRTADLRDTLLDGTVFKGANLTGALFAGASGYGVSFAGSTCPDGKPASAGAGFAACRIAP